MADNNKKTRMDATHNEAGYTTTALNERQRAIMEEFAQEEVVNGDYMDGELSSADTRIPDPAAFNIIPAQSLLFSGFNLIWRELPKHLQSW
uniref:Uncharacterized protein n=1 Tax=Solanum lycopersicum TaxID=4081 RepID=A0A3Q7F220_SOLLC